MKPKRDQQRARVYAWENRIVAPHDPTMIAFSAAQAMVNAIWAEMGLRYPPSVEPLPPQSRRTLASANRLTLYLPAQTPSWCLLHELAHAMTTTMEGESDGHGELFMGIYCQLLARYLRLDPENLHRTAQQDSIRIAPTARPVFLDPSLSPSLRA